MRMVHDSFVDYPTPKNLNYWWTFGGILSFCLGDADHHRHHPGDALHAECRSRFLERARHHARCELWLADALYSLQRRIDVLRRRATSTCSAASITARTKSPREMLWILGMLIYVLMMAAAFFGYVLVWGQMSFWGATVITNIFGAIPGVGKAITEMAVGRLCVANPTLNRFFSLHYLVPFLIAGVVVLHVWALHVVGQNNPTGIEPKDKGDTVPFTPYATVKDGFAISLFVNPVAPISCSLIRKAW